MKTLRLNGFFDWIRYNAVPVDGITGRDDNACESQRAELDEERDIVAPRVEPLPREPVRWGNFR